MSFTDEIRSYIGKVTGIYPLPAVLQPSPLLNIYGGPIVGYVGEEGVFKPISTYYQVDIEFPSACPASSRTGLARLDKYSSIAGNLLRKAASVLRRELSF